MLKINTASRMRNLFLSSGVAFALVVGGSAAANADAPDINLGTSTGGYAGVGTNSDPSYARYDPGAVPAACKAQIDQTGQSGKLKLYDSAEKSAVNNKVTTSRITPNQKDYIPVLMVHGWTGDRNAFLDPIDKTSPDSKRSLTRSDKSLVGLIQQIPGAAVYSYEYTQKSNRWVTSTGDGLAAAINCLYQQSGRKVIVITHSMGGLNTRYAVANTSAGNAVSEVITFGTPELGSKIAQAAWALTGEKADGYTSDIGTLKYQALVHGLKASFSLDGKVSAIQWAIAKELFTCSQISERKQALKACGDAALTGFNGDAGRALRSNSPTILALASRKWPSSVHVTALYGDLDLTTFGLAYARKNPVGTTLILKGTAQLTKSLDENTKQVYGKAAAKPKLDVARPGDGLVTADSATYDADANEKVGVQCAIVDRDMKDKIHSTSGFGYENLTKTACFHSNLMRSTKLAYAAVDRVRAQVNSEVVPADNGSELDKVRGWTLSNYGLGSVLLGQHAEDASKVTGVDYSAYVKRWVAARAESKHLVCDKSYTSFLGTSKQIMVGFDPLYDSRNTAVGSVEFHEEWQSVNDIWILSSGDPTKDARLPKTSLGIGIGSSAQDLFAVYNVPTTQRTVADGVLWDSTMKAGVGQENTAVFGYNEQAYQVHSANGQFGGSSLNFKVTKGVIVGMKLSSGGGFWSEPVYQCSQEYSGDYSIKGLPLVQ